MLEGQDDTVLDLLYRYCIEGNTSKEPQAREYYKQLDDLIQSLNLEDNDRVCDLVCDLCIFHERFAFIEGVCVGAQLSLELSQKEKPPRGDTGAEDIKD